LLRERRGAPAVLLGPRQSEPTVLAEELLPLDADLPRRLVGGAAASTELGELATEVLPEPRPHLGAERRLLGGVREVHRPRTLLPGNGRRPGDGQQVGSSVLCGRAAGRVPDCRGRGRAFVRILCTNQAFVTRGGTESYLLTVIPELVLLGHEVVLWSPQLGDLADELRAIGCRVEGDLAAVGAADVIHAHHASTALAARAQLPTTPM